LNNSNTKYHHLLFYKFIIISITIIFYDNLRLSLRFVLIFFKLLQILVTEL